MPPAGYLSTTGIESCLVYLATTYPSICQLIVLPETSIEGRTIRAIKLANPGGGGANRRGVLMIGGVHARELINPDTLASLALKMCQSYTGGTNLVFGGKTYEAGTIKILIDGMDLFFLPLVNPDGRTYVQSPTGDAMWRKNRNPNPGQPCKGVDLNRNFEFLWPSGIGTSASSCSDTFKGNAAFSEPETRNVRHMLNTYTNICCFVDVHSYSELVLYPWGDDDNQTTNATMNFKNPAFNGLRGTPGDAVYKEYIPAADLDWYVKTGNRIRDGIAAVRGRVYTVMQSIGHYPTTGTSEDYAYSRNFVDPSKRKVRGYTIETARQFQPPIAEATEVMKETSAGLLEFCMSCMCAVETTLQGTALSKELGEMRELRDEDMLETAAGRKYTELLQKNSVEIMKVLSKDEKLRARVVEMAKAVNEISKTRHAKKPKAFDAKLITEADKLLQNIAAKGGASFKKDVERVRGDLKHFKGHSVLKGLDLASRTIKPSDSE